MFAHPSTVHLPRTYSHVPHTTGRKNVNKENPSEGGYGGLPSKTPSRAGTGAGAGAGGLGKAAPGTALRVGLGPKTEGRDRNVLGAGGQQGAGRDKGKGKDGMDIEPKRLFASTSGSTSKTSIPPSKSLGSLPALNTHTQLKSKSLLPSKTPARAPPSTRPTRLLRTPAPSLQPYVEPAPTPLPSATRTRRRSRQSLTQSVTPIKETGGFETPAPSGRWEEEHSLDNITEGVEGIELGTVVKGGPVEEGSDGEVEYMPPPVQELPWEPAWTHPDLSGVLSSLSSLPPLWRPDSPVRRASPPLQLDEIDEKQGHVKMRSNDDIEEPIFRRSAKSEMISSNPSKRPAAAIAPLSRPGTAPPKARFAPTTTTSTLKPKSTIPAKSAVPSGTTPAVSAVSAVSVARQPVRAPINASRPTKSTSGGAMPPPARARLGSGSVPSIRSVQAKGKEASRVRVREPAVVEDDLVLHLPEMDDVGLGTETFDLGLDDLFAFQAAFAAYSVPAKTDRFYDFAGSLGFISSTILSLYYPAIRSSLRGIPVKWNLDTLVRAHHPRQLLGTAMVVIWAGRLGSFLFQRVLKAGHDSRFDEIKTQPSRFAVFWFSSCDSFALTHDLPNIFLFFIFLFFISLFFIFLFFIFLFGQATWITLVSLPVLLLNSIPASAHPALGLKDLLAVGLWAGGLGLEVVADRQKSSWRQAKNEKKHEEKFISSGVWSLSRHPNYLGEIILQTGPSLLSLPSLPGPTVPLALLSPLFTYLLLRYASGVPPLEKSAEKKWGEDPAWRKYTNDTAVLVPWPFGKGRGKME
ncbi:hypothetical protein JCM24511_00667 [Saitozyma sp. JCM 24511]|nr:hypothetical protein JCM24511_00667 [Saitozyma sp. JCM 24511]